jgi:DeoR/GlpR family transcriptional regulator of sugar metabolism
VRGASESFEQQATFKTRLVQFAENVVLLVDSSKLDARSEYFFAEPDQISEIITDSEADPELVKKIRDLGINLTLAD